MICFILFRSDPESSGCNRHFQRRQIYRCGNPKKSESLKNEKKIGAAALIDHKSKGGAALTPLDLIQIRTHLLSTGNLADFMLWVMICICIRLFLRAEELVGINIDPGI
jgi:hypothetical protein